MSWATIISSRTPSAASSRASATTSSIGLVTCLPRICGIAQNVHSRSQPSEIFRNAKCRGVIRSRAVSGQRVSRGRVEHHPLLVQPAQQPIGNLGDFLAAEDADQVIDSRSIHEQRLFLPLGQAARHDHAPQFAAAFQLQHLVDGGERFLPGRLDEAAGVDDHEVGAARIVDQLVAVELQQPQHPLAVDEVLRAAEADKGVAAFGRAARELGGEGGGHGAVETIEIRRSGEATLIVTVAHAAANWW